MCYSHSAGKQTCRYQKYFSELLLKTGIRHLDVATVYLSEVVTANS